MYVGYRVLESGGWAWIARRYTDERKKAYRSLGELATHDDAVRAAREWADASDQGVVEHDATVADACRAHVKHQRVKKPKSSSKDAEERFKQLVYDKPVGRIALAKLRTTQVRDWLNDQVADDEGEEVVRRSKDSAHRNLASLKATFYVWKKKYGGLGVSEMRRLKQLEEENRRLRSMVADLSLDKEMVQEVIRKKL